MYSCLLLVVGVVRGIWDWRFDCGTIDGQDSRADWLVSLTSRDIHTGTLMVSQRRMRSYRSGTCSL
jgi:hypothetical protein